MDVQYVLPIKPLTSHALQFSNSFLNMTFKETSSELTTVALDAHFAKYLSQESQGAVHSICQQIQEKQKGEKKCNVPILNL